MDNDIPTNLKVLSIAHEAIRQESERIEKLLDPKAENTLPSPLREHADIIRQRFSLALDTVRQKLQELEEAIRQSNIEKGWEHYASLRTNLIPTLSSELLAVIGGLYLHNQKLDSLPGSSGQETPIQFSKLAGELIDNLNKCTGMGWKSVLIVGEEKLDYSNAEIIRLRFPACDIWNLPFTAHEYGYVVAHKDLSLLEGNKREIFHQLREEVRTNMNLSKRLPGNSPQHCECYLDKVKQIWLDYDQLPTQDERRSFTEKHRKSLYSLAKGQESFLCRLFADAFATYCVGPAYVYAMLYLRFLPEDVALYNESPFMPSFVLRFVVVLETLMWMNKMWVNNPLGGDYPFKELIGGMSLDKSSPIPALYIQTVKRTYKELANMQTVDEKKELTEDERIWKQYDDIKERYQYWLSNIQEALNGFYTAREKLYENWKMAEELYQDKGDLLAEPKCRTKPNPWAVLNAAWYLRDKCPRELSTIEANAIRLLDPEYEKKSGLSGGTARRSPSVESVRRSTPPSEDEDIRTIENALQNYRDHLDLFKDLVRAKNFAPNTNLENILGNLPDGLNAYKAYKRWYQQTYSR